MAFLRRVYSSLERDEERDAIDALEAHALHLIPASQAEEALARAEEATQSWFWAHWSGCLCMDGIEVLEGDQTLSCAGTRLAELKHLAAGAAHKARQLAADPEQEARAQRHLYNDIIGPLLWKPEGMGGARDAPAVRGLVLALNRQRQPDPLGMLALADALEEAGCANTELLEHCRSDGLHSRGCWVIEELSGRASRRLPREDSRPAKKAPAPLVRMKRSAVKPPNQARP